MIPKIFKHGNFLPTLKYVLGKEGASIIGTNMNSATPNELVQHGVNSAPIKQLITQVASY
ncbi:MAG: hypothetical protein KME31_27120 [Tolypothrix carrinoi HA7290-LM1]|nr:hypothetical protein [Tolypothrix carrinoi HA7290-LM1]